MKNLLLLISLLSSVCSFSQANKSDKQNITLSGGKSFNGSGDMSGFGFLTEYASYHKRWSLNVGIGSTIHHQKDYLIYTRTLQNGSTSTTTQSLDELTAGIQLQALGGYSFVQTKKSDLQIGLGPILRYQIATLTNGYGVRYPAVTDWPDPLFELPDSKSNTFSFGGQLRLQYQYHFSKKFFAGIHGSFQTDTNGDAITTTYLSIGRTF